jgi:hypothetical protein
MPGRTIAALLVCAASLVLAAPALALDIADASPPSGVVGVPYSYTFSLSPGSGSPGASWSISSGALPPGLRLSSNDRTGTVLGTPTQAGSFRFYVKVRDKPGPWVCCTEEEFTISIDPALAIVNGPDLPSGAVGAAYGYQLATSGGTASSWTVASGSLPAGMSLSPSGALVGTPSQAALARFTVRAVDGSKVAAKELTVRVTEPVIVTPPATRPIKLGHQFLIAFAAKGGLAPYTWAGVDLPQGVGLNPTTGQVGGRPQAPGDLTITVKITDALGTTQTASATVSTVTPLRIETAKLPLARNGKRFAGRLVTSGGAGPFTLRLVGLKPGWLRFDAAHGTLTGTPKLKPRKPRILVKHTSKGTRRIAKHRPPVAATYNLYLVATDGIGQRATRKLKLTVRP